MGGQEVVSSLTQRTRFRQASLDRAEQSVVFKVDHKFVVAASRRGISRNNCGETPQPLGFQKNMPVLLLASINTSQLHQERKPCRNKLQTIKASRCSTVTGVHVGLHQQHIVTLFHDAKFGDPFRWLPVLNL